LNFIKMKNLHSVKEPKMMKSQATEWEKLFMSITSDKEQELRTFKAQ
jgi:hypothetical protein